MFAWLKHRFGKVSVPGPARWVDCPACQGWGRVCTLDAGVTGCPQCRGAKKLRLTEADVAAIVAAQKATRKGKG